MILARFICSRCGSASKPEVFPGTVSRRILRKANPTWTHPSTGDGFTDDLCPTCTDKEKHA